MSSRQQYLWQRRWKRIESRLDGSSDAPDQQNETQESLNALSKVPCLILLGAPGLGKSNELNLAASVALANGDAADIVSLGRVTSPEDFRELLLRKAARPDVQERHWSLFLDGLDEASDSLISSRDSISAALRSLASVKPLQNVSLRLSCRSAEWPTYLEAELRNIWGASNVLCYELQELNEQDIALAAHEQLKDSADAFLSQIEGREVDALAKRPITLRMLLDVYDAELGLPHRRVQLYRQSLLTSIEQTNEKRRDGNLSPQDTLIVAARIAAASLFSDCTQVYAGDGTPPDNGRTVNLSTLTGGLEPTGTANSFQVEESELRRTLLSPIFSAVSDDTYAWSHQTFLEFLAAYYLVEHGLTAQQLVDFLYPPGSARIPPQLKEVSAWIASMNESFFETLTARQPDILLYSDVAAASPSARASLVARLLSQFETAELHDFDYSIRLRYDRLGHDALADQLLPYITDRNRDLVVRRAAIDIAEANRETRLQTTLADVALDETDILETRRQAAAAVVRIASKATKERLRPLLSSHLDENDELKGYALKALWPNTLSFNELLQALTPERNSSWIGSYASFLYELDLPQLSDQEAISALHWVATALQSDAQSSTFDRVIPKLLRGAWDRADNDAVLTAWANLLQRMFSDATYYSLERFSSDLFKEIRGTDARRRQLIKKIIAQSENNAVSWLAHAFPAQLVTSDDLEWLLEAVTSPTASLPEEATSQLILTIINRGDLDGLEAVWNASEKSPLLAHGLEGLFSCELFSSVSEWQRKDFHRVKARAAKAEQKKFDAVAAIERKLREIEQDSFGWWELNLAFLADESGQLVREFNSDITASPIWGSLNPDLQTSIITSAARYLTENSPRSTSWIGTNTFHRPAAAGYRALRILQALSSEVFSSLPSDVWKSWVSSLFVSFNDTRSDDPSRREITLSAYLKAPKKLLNVATRAILKATSQHDIRQITSALDHCFDDAWGALYFRLIPRLKDDTASELASFLASKRYQPLIDLLIRRMKGREADHQFSETCFVRAMSSGLLRDPQALWDTFFSFSRDNEALALEVVHALADSYQYDRSGFIEDLTEQQLVDFYVWTYRRIAPPVWDKSARWMGSDDHVDHMRNNIVQRLTTEGTPAAVDAMKRLSEAVPEAPWLRYKIVDARRAMDASAWLARDAREVVWIIASYQSLPAPKPRNSGEEIYAGRIESERVVELLSETAALEIIKDQQPSSITRRHILAVATEWSSAHGGLSTLNRELCRSLAKLNHHVVCYVLDASSGDIDDAKSAGVHLVQSPRDPHPLTDLSRLLLFSPELVAPFVPDLVIGHDHITGTAAHHIARRVFERQYVHFVHTLPEEIERYKTRGKEGQYVLDGARKARVQLEQCKSSDLVVAIGPKILRGIRGRLVLTSVPIVEMRPGLNERLLRHEVDHTKLGSVDCLLMARFEDPDLKGAPLACRLIAQLNARFKGDVWQKPRLILRGFTLTAANDEVSQIMGYQDAQNYITCRPFTDDVDEVAADICAASIVLMPSRSEGFGLAALEAISAGVPVLLTSDSGLGHLLSDTSVFPTLQPLVKHCVADVDEMKSDVTSDWVNRLEAILGDPPRHLLALGNFEPPCHMS